jgi:hypothetical protein
LVIVKNRLNCTQELEAVAGAFEYRMADEAIELIKKVIAIRSGVRVATGRGVQDRDIEEGPEFGGVVVDV